MAVLRVTEAFVVFRSGNPEFYNPGELVDESDPVVKGREALFGPEDPPRVVRAAPRAAPAPSRRRRRPGNKAAAKKAAAKTAAPKEHAEAPASTSNEGVPSSEVL